MILVVEVHCGRDTDLHDDLMQRCLSDTFADTAQLLTQAKYQYRPIRFLQYFYQLSKKELRNSRIYNKR